MLEDVPPVFLKKHFVLYIVLLLITSTGNNILFPGNDHETYVCDRFREVCAEGARLMIDLIENEDQRDCKTILLKPVLYPGNSVRVIDSESSKQIQS